MASLNSYINKRRLTLYFDSCGRSRNVKQIATLIYLACNYCKARIDTILLAVFTEQSKEPTLLPIPNVPVAFSLDQLWQKLTALLPEFKTGFFGRSELRDNLQVILNRYMPPYINNLPNEVLIAIFNILDFISLTTAKTVSKRWHEIGRTDYLWKKFIQQKYLSPSANYYGLLQRPLAGTYLFTVGESLVVADAYDKNTDLFHFRENFSSAEIKGCFLQEPIIKLFATEKDAIAYKHSKTSIHKDYVDADVIFGVRIAADVTSEEKTETLSGDKLISYLCVKRQDITLVYGRIKNYTTKVYFEDKESSCDKRNSVRCNTYL